MKVLEKTGEVCYNQTCVTARFRLMPEQRYAMKRKVADGASGNFRGVCPISNRATVIPNTVCAYASCEGGVPLWRGCGVCVSCFGVRKAFAFFGYF